MNKHQNYYADMLQGKMTAKEALEKIWLGMLEFQQEVQENNIEYPTEEMWFLHKQKKLIEKYLND